MNTTIWFLIAIVAFLLVGAVLVVFDRWTGRRHPVANRFALVFLGLSACTLVLSVGLALLAPDWWSPGDR